MLFIDWRKGNMSNKCVTLDEFLNERGDFVKQVVYKVDGDFNGDIKGENVTVILMGDGDINGDVSSKNGDVVLIKGNINGDVKANKVICQSQPTNEETRHNPAKDVDSPVLPLKYGHEHSCYDCIYYGSDNRCSLFGIYIDRPKTCEYYIENKYFIYKEVL